VTNWLRDQLVATGRGRIILNTEVKSVTYNARTGVTVSNHRYNRLCTAASIHFQGAKAGEESEQPLPKLTPSTSR
jgi:hypothetical protein